MVSSLKERKLFKGGNYMRKYGMHVWFHVQLVQKILKGLQRQVQLTKLKVGQGFLLESELNTYFY